MNNDYDETCLSLCGAGLTVESFVHVARNPEVKVKCAPIAVARVDSCRKHIDSLVEEYEKAWRRLKGKNTLHKSLPLIYGVTTGFGGFKGIPVSPEQLLQLQSNILLSHSAGVGSDANEHNLSNYLPAEVVRGALILRLNTFLKGNSGVRTETIGVIEAMLNSGIIPLVPLRGSLGSSGDLCPLAHLFATLLGKGRYYVVTTSCDIEEPIHTHKIKSSADDLEADMSNCLTQNSTGAALEWPFRPHHKEGLALTNGAAFSAAMLALAVNDAVAVSHVADIAAALGFEALCGRVRCLDQNVHNARGLEGQKESAANIRSMLEGSKEVERTMDTQDAYSLRCAPQVHGATRDTIAYARMIIEREMNAATDNPLFFPGESPWDLHFGAAEEVAECRDDHAYSAGNFHGQPVGLAADILAMSVAELANISERRTQMLLDRNHNRRLPANLISNRGVNSGLMIAQYSAASLVSENKVLTHPASVDSIPTSANSEDHVAMAMLATRKLRDVLKNVEAVLAIELLCVTQAIDWRATLREYPNLHKEALTPNQAKQESEIESSQFASATDDSKRIDIANRLGRGSRSAYLTVREVVSPLNGDCMLDGHIRTIWNLIRKDRLVGAAREATENAFSTIRPLLYSNSDSFEN